MRITKVFSPNSILKQWREELLTKNKNIRCFEDLRVAPLPIEFVSQALIKWVMESYHGVCHLSPDKDMSYYELGLHLAKTLGKSENTVKATKAGELVNYKPRKANLDCTGPYSCAYSLADCLDKAIRESE